MLKTLGPEVVIVDDKYNEIEGITTFLSEKSIGYKYLNSDTSNGDELPTETIDTVKILFLDFYYSETFDPEIIAGWVDAIIPENHFYFLIAWSKHPEKLSLVLNELNRINKYPIFHIEKLKKDYKTDDNFDFETLMIDIDTKLDEFKGAKELINWKKGIESAANKVILGIAKEKDEIEKKIKKIICVQGGKRIKDAPPLEKLVGLYDALDYVLSSNSKNFRINDISQNSVCNITLANRDFLYKDNDLNTWFLLKKNPNGIEPIIETGTIFQLKDANLKSLFSITKYSTFKDFYDYDTNAENIYHICILVTPACDFSQKKHGGNFKFISGLIINNIGRDGDKIIFNNDRYVPTDSMTIIDNININKLNLNNATLIFDNKYSFSAPDEDVYNIDKFDPICTVTKDLISDIQVKYAAHSARIGYLYM